MEKAYPKITVLMDEVIKTAYLERVSLSTTGYYKTPDIHWDRAKGRGKPFHYFAYGVAVTEVEVDGFTGMAQVVRVIPDPTKDIGFNILARFHYHKNPRMNNCETMIEALKLLAL